jgi:hypothetical protein
MGRCRDGLNGVRGADPTADPHNFLNLPAVVTKLWKGARRSDGWMTSRGGSVSRQVPAAWRRRPVRVSIVTATISLLALLGALTLPGHAGALSTAATTTDPDSYVCQERGYVDFESFADKADLSATTIPGVHFTTTDGYTWLVGDFVSGAYNGKYPTGSYTSQGSHWAWLGENEGRGRIDLTDGPASVFKPPHVIQLWYLSGSLRRRGLTTRVRRAFHRQYKYRSNVGAEDHPESGRHFLPHRT